MSTVAVIEASSAKSGFGQLGARAKEAPIKVTRHGKVEFVIISPEMFAEVEGTAAAPAGELERMQREFDALCRAMQSDRSNAAYDALEALSAPGLPGAVKKARRSGARAAAKSRLQVAR